MSEFSGVIKAPRWFGVSSAIKSICADRGLKCEIDVKTGWLRETVRFTVTGERWNLAAFEMGLISALEDSGASIENVSRQRHT